MEFPPKKTERTKAWVYGIKVRLHFEHKQISKKIQHLQICVSYITPLYCVVSDHYTPLLNIKLLLV